MDVDDVWSQFATHWQKPVVNADQDVVRKIYTALEAESFSLQSLSRLDSFQCLEKFLWPSFSENAANPHVLLIAAIINLKRQGGILNWSIFEDGTENFSRFFHRALSLILDSSLPIASCLLLLNFIIGAFQSLEQEIIRKECAPLVSIATWHHLHDEETRDKELDQIPSRRRAWKSSQKRFDAAGQEGQTRLRFDRAWLYSMVIDFLKRINSPAGSLQDKNYGQRFLEFLIDLVSQLPTRRYTVVLLKDLNVLPVVRLSQMYKQNDNGIFQDLTKLYQHFLDFAVDDIGAVTSSDDAAHYKSLQALQKAALQHFEGKLKVLALSNFASISQAGELKGQLSTLSDIELEQLCAKLGFRTSYPSAAGIPTGRQLFLEILVTAYSKPLDLRDSLGKRSILPTDENLYDQSLVRNETYDGVTPLSTPKLNLQYLSLSDFLWRSFSLYQTESFYDVKKDMESIVRKLNPRNTPTGGTSFSGFARMALPIDKPGIIDVAPPKVGSSTPGYVRAEVVLDVSRLGDKIRSEWDSLRPKDVVFLLSVQASDPGRLSNGHTNHSNTSSSPLVRLRSAEVVQVQDEKGKPLRDVTEANGYARRQSKRRLILDFDPVAFQRDKDRLRQGKPDVYASINVIARRAGRENNFKPILETIANLIESQTTLPTWLQEVYLGYGNPNSASFTEIATKIEKLDFLDTFIDWDHLRESFPNRELESEDKKTLQPPFIIEPFSTSNAAQPNNPRKRRRDQMENEAILSGPVRVSTYKPANNGPYPVDIPKKNLVKFTPKQVEAIVSGTQPGLSLIVGPPGTGKTDVATQIINLLYHNFPSERILLIAHSNQALNQLFQKIVALDIDARHLLRLGHGEEDLDTETSYSKYGRVDSFMENRQYFLGEVSRLAASIGVEGAHGNSCETAGYFNQVYVQPAWTQFWLKVKSPEASREVLYNAFPFHKYFSNAPIPELFPSDATIEGLMEVAEGCQRHLNKIFNELESIRPFEILRQPRDQANHLLIKEARIIAMTSTHAAIRRADIAALGFHYDTLVMEEAAQITEIESFIPCAMQKSDPNTGELPLKRIVLVGDHLQNSPVVQNLALKQYANFDQSLFLRLIRLGVPTITLDAQGRCRPSIANLFSWRYPNLTNLPHIDIQPEFMRANAGFAHVFQFINVDDYKGAGESEPSPHFIQNLGEAEYAVALYQYMRLLGYPAKSISILTTYAGQKALIQDVLAHRCRGNRLFSLPRIVTTVDKYQGEQNDYVILSLVRTKSVGYLRDVRRLTVALSRARLGLYILGRKSLFETSKEMETAMARLNVNSNDNGHLEIVTGEMFPTKRKVDDSVEEGKAVEMHGTKHLGQYVFEMTQAKVKSMGGNVQLLTGDGEEEDELVVEEDDPVHEAEADPLHETV